MLNKFVFLAQNGAGILCN